MSAEQRSLWDAPEAAEPDGPMAPAPPSSVQAAPRILRVSDLNRRVRQLLDSDAALADVWVEGEVSQPSFPPSGHCFFTLKDAQSQVRRRCCSARSWPVANVRPEHGMQVIIHGRLRAYEPQGVYQLYVMTLTPAGAGDLHQRYEQLRAKLAAEGLFEDARKRPVPRWPRRIGVVTSPVGVVWRDIANVLRRRYPLGELVLVPTNVQGAAAAAWHRPRAEAHLRPAGDRPRHPGAWRRLAGGPVVVQRRAGGADHRAARRCRSSWASVTSRT